MKVSFKTICFSAIQGVMILAFCSPLRAAAMQNPNPPLTVPPGPINGQWITLLWRQLATLKIPTMALYNAYTLYGATPQYYPNGDGDVRFDCYGVAVVLPAGTGPQDIFRELRDRIADVGSRSGPDNFGGSVGWPNAGPGDPRFNGCVVDLDLGIEYGAVAYFNTTLDGGWFGVFTVANDTSGTHPVYGIRIFGYHLLGYDTTGKPIYFFFTSAIDRAAVDHTDTIGNLLQTATWNKLLDLLVRDIVSDGGNWRFRVSCWNYMDPSSLQSIQLGIVDGPGWINWIFNWGYAAWAWGRNRFLINPSTQPVSVPQSGQGGTPGTIPSPSSQPVGDPESSISTPEGN